MAESSKTTFTPIGGMNTDDSIITPAKDAAGKSLFELGDYRYANNLRIGSSKSDNFGDAENLKGTAEVTAYRVKNQLMVNPEFSGSIAGWSVIDLGLNWAYNSGKAVINYSVGFFQSDILYQALTLIPGTFVSLKILVGATFATVNGFKFKIHLLNGTTVLSTTEYLINKQFASPEEVNASIQIPSGCNGIGFSVEGTGIGGGVAAVEYFRTYAWVSSSSPSGTEKVIGRLEDEETLNIYSSVYNSNGNHTIRQYSFVDDCTYELLRWSGLNFQETFFVKLAKLNNWIAVTDRNNRPRLIDVDTITDLSLYLGSDFREFHISFHKWQPAAPPIPRIYYDGSTNNFSKLKNKTYQFAMQYVYNGNLKSRWSPISKAAPVTNIASGSNNFYNAEVITSIEVEIRGSVLDQEGANIAYNYFDHNDIKFLAAVEYIQLAYRDSQLSPWRLWKRVPKSNGTFPTSVYFDGGFIGSIIDSADFSQPFDTVPIKAGTVDTADNRFVFGDILEEYEPITNFSVADVSAITDPATDWDDANAASSFPQFSSGIRNKLLRLNTLSHFNLKARGLYKAGILFADHTGKKSLTYSPDNWFYEVGDNGQYRLNAFRFTIPTDVKPPSWATSYQIVRTNVSNIDYFMIGVANKFTPLLDNASSLIGSASLPDNIKNKLSVHFENTNIVDGYDVADRIRKAEKKYKSQFLFENLTRKRSTNNYLLFNSLRFKIGPEIRSSKTDVISNSSRIYIDINNWYNAARETSTKNRLLSKMYYNFREGDRVRFYGSESTSPGSGDFKIYDLEILEFTGSGLIVEKPVGLAYIPIPNTDSDSRHQIEVYTPVDIPTDDDSVFYEIGEWYPVLYPGTDNRDFAKRDWNYTNNPAVTVATYGPFDVFSKMPLFYGDCFKISKIVYKDFPSTGVGVGTSMNPDPDKVYDIWERNAGRPSIAYLDLPVSEFKETMGRFGGKIVDDSNLNQLNRFKELDNFVYPSEYGRIREIVNTANAQVESTGSILLFIGEREAWSVYVNRTTLEDLSGRTQFLLSDKVLGSYNVLLGSHGTMNPESVSKKHGRVYWWDAIDGSWIRYGRDGLTEISEYKMRNWFRELGNILATKYQSDELPRVVSGYDPFNEELVTFISHSELPETFRGYATYKGSLFSEDDTRWKSCHNYEPEFFAKMANVLFSFKVGKIYKHEQDGVDYNTFYGAKYDSYIEPVFNQFSLAMKSWQWIALTTTDAWSAERILSEYRGTKDKQESRLLTGKFQQKEDHWYSEILKDLNTPNGGYNVINDGNKMRSKAIQVLLKLNPSVVTLSLLQYVTVGFTDSPKNP